MNIRLNVPYKEKDLAKSNGARWNPDLKTWYINDVSLLQGVSQWLGNFNIICENLFLLKMNHPCWKCKKEIEVVCLATNKSYVITTGRYKMNSNLQILSYVQEMPNPLTNYLEALGYTASYSKTINDIYYINHCKHCKNIQGDNFIHEIPQQAFYKKLLYHNSAPTSYSKIRNTFYVPLLAQLPFYDEVHSNIDLLFEHMETGVENRASLRVTQKLINGLFDCSIKGSDIGLSGL